MIVNEPVIVVETIQNKRIKKMKINRIIEQDKTICSAIDEGEYVSYSNWNVIEVGVGEEILEDEKVDWFIKGLENTFYSACINSIIEIYDDKKVKINYYYNRTVFFTSLQEAVDYLRCREAEEA